MNALSVGAYLSLTLQRCDSGELATSLLVRHLRFSMLKARGMKLAKSSGFKKYA